MFAWISRYNGSMPELGTLNNTCMYGTKKNIIKFAKQYGNKFCKVEVNLFYNEDNRYGQADETIHLTD